MKGCDILYVLYNAPFNGVNIAGNVGSDSVGETGGGTKRSYIE